MSRLTAASAFSLWLFTLTNVVLAEPIEFKCPFRVENTVVPAKCIIFPKNKFYAFDGSVEVDISPVIEAFADRLSSALNKSSCRESIEVRSANLFVESGHLIAEARVWIRKQVCELGSSATLFEREGDLRVSFSPVVENGEIGLVSDVQNDGLNEIERAVLRELGVDVARRIKDSLDKNLRVRAAEIPLPGELSRSFNFVSIVLGPDAPVMRVELSARISPSELSELIFRPE